MRKEWLIRCFEERGLDRNDFIFRQSKDKKGCFVYAKQTHIDRRTLEKVKNIDWFFRYDDDLLHLGIEYIKQKLNAIKLEKKR